MIRVRALLFLCSLLAAPVLMAQSENCVSLLQQDSSISIPVGIGGSQSVAVLNTGTLPVGISNTLAQSLGLAVEPVPATNRIWSAIPAIKGQINNVPINVFGQDFQIEQMYVIDNPQRFVYISLLLFRGLVMQVDFPQSQLCFIPRTAMNLKDAANIELRSSQGRPVIQVALNNDQKVWLELQIEHAGAIELNKASAERLGFAAPNDATGASNTGSAENQTAILDLLNFGPYELGNINVSYSTRDTPAATQAQPARTGARAARARRGSVESDGLIGREVLKHFVITIDLEEELLHAWVP